jgi:uncharacterized protein with HEPN domain
MLDAARAIAGFVRGKQFADYLADRMLRGAVERHLEIMGEAAKRVSETLREAHPEIAWGWLMALRNVLAHEYGEIRHERIWSVCIERLPGLIRRLEALGIDDNSRASA